MSDEADSPTVGGVIAEFRSALDRLEASRAKEDDEEREPEESREPDKNLREAGERASIRVRAHNRRARQARAEPQGADGREQ